MRMTFSNHFWGALAMAASIASGAPAGAADLMPFAKQPPRQMKTDEAGGSGDQIAHATTPAMLATVGASLLTARANRRRPSHTTAGGLRL